MKSLKMKILILLLLQVVLSNAAKMKVKPTYEVNEQAKAEEKKSSNVQGVLPYGNPLAGNLLQNAKLHAQNQQAMFQAERIRQHRLQTQRWAKSHQPTDSYMKAYHDTQESHQLALEQEQSKINEKVMSPTNKENVKRIKTPELTKITKEDAIMKPQRRRNHRSYGSMDYHNYYHPRHQNVQIQPGTGYEQGITVKPNGITFFNKKQTNKLYDETKTQYYPKQYNHFQYASTQDITALNALLKKSPQDQLTELKAMANKNDKANDILETPIKLYFYENEAKPSEPHKNTLYTEVPQFYANAYTSRPDVKEYTPINEEVDDIEDPNKVIPFQANALQTILSTKKPTDDTSTVNYLNVVTQPIEFYTNANTGVEQTAYQTLKEDSNYLPNVIVNEKPTEIYLRQNVQTIGVQHLNQDGQEIPAYTDENLQYASNYEFGYRVRDQHSGNYFGHQEAKKDGQTNGHYHVLLPDGRMQKVQYHAGPSGFHADITYDHAK